MLIVKQGGPGLRRDDGEFFLNVGNDSKDIFTSLVVNTTMFINLHHVIPTKVGTSKLQNVLTNIRESKKEPLAPFLFW
ncbi:hypothetical protein A9Q98_06930 [Thalassotalea sp. 42_200_T64]|nr:hypothetical protein A9Q98_06930 [Thalassotalea sp. 42_200_T64]